MLNAVKPTVSGGVLKSTNAKTSAANTSGTTTSSSGTGSANGLGTTFLSLLAQELQNQDPTAPVDPTAMVGQMISLNQLEQLININQSLTGSPAPASATGVVHDNGAASDVAGSMANGGIANSLSPSTAGAAFNQLPFDPNTMMPVSYSTSNSAASSINSSINAANMGLSGTNNNSSGGK